MARRQGQRGSQSPTFSTISLRTARARRQRTVARTAVAAHHGGAARITGTPVLRRGTISHPSPGPARRRWTGDPHARIRDRRRDRDRSRADGRVPKARPGDPRRLRREVRRPRRRHAEGARATGPRTASSSSSSPPWTRPAAGETPPSTETPRPCASKPAAQTSSSSKASHSATPRRARDIAPRSPTTGEGEVGSAGAARAPCSETPRAAGGSSASSRVTSPRPTPSGGWGGRARAARYLLPSRRYQVRARPLPAPPRPLINRNRPGPEHLAR